MLVSLAGNIEAGARDSRLIAAHSGFGCKEKFNHEHRMMVGIDS